jgi:predicted nucleotide-binding protein
MSDNNKITNDERAAATAGGYSSDNYVSTEEISKTTITKRVIHRAILAFILFTFGLSIYYSSYPLGFYFDFSRVRDDNNKVWSAVGIILTIYGIAQFILLNYLEFGAVFPSLKGTIVTTIITRRVTGRAVVGLVLVAFGLSLYYLSDLLGAYISLGLNLGPPGNDGIQTLAASIGLTLAFAGLGQFSLLNYLEFGSVLPSITETIASRTSTNALKGIKKASHEAALHVELAEQRQHKMPANGGTVFIGHGRALVWLQLKDFLKDTLHLDVDEFNSVSTAGIPTVTRLQEMLEAAKFAFLLMTAEDEQPDGSLNARQNVVHEAGLFQGRLGFNKAIVLIEEHCQDFSNIRGLTYISFPKGNVKAAFEDVRRVLAREGVISVD